MEPAANTFGYYPSPCCANYTFPEPPTGHYDICPVCFWEDDPIQGDDPAYEGGANHVSLHQARLNYRDLGACEPRLQHLVRRPTADELPEER
ncbi:CPCC family cysteine-rich protein [Hymenobacter sp. HD11105]